MTNKQKKRGNAPEKSPFEKWAVAMAAAFERLVDAASVMPIEGELAQATTIALGRAQVEAAHVRKELAKGPAGGAGSIMAAFADPWKDTLKAMILYGRDIAMVVEEDPNVLLDDAALAAANNIRRTIRKAVALKDLADGTFLAQLARE